MDNRPSLAAESKTPQSVLKSYTSPTNASSQKSKSVNAGASAGKQLAGSPRKGGRMPQLGAVKEEQIECELGSPRASLEIKGKKSKKMHLNNANEDINKTQQLSHHVF